MDHVLRDDIHVHSVAEQSELCIVFVSLFLVEGWDREHLQLDHDGELLIQRVEASCAGKVVVVMHTGGQVVVEDWIDLPRIGSVIWAGYPGESTAGSLTVGQESGNALVSVLWGDVNPSAKVSEVLRNDYLIKPSFHSLWAKLAPIGPRYPLSSIDRHSPRAWQSITNGSISGELNRDLPLVLDSGKSRRGTS